MSEPYAFAAGSRNRLTRRDAARFPGDTLFERIARVVCEAECLPRKELFESWEVAKRVRRRLRGGVVWDLAGGHGLLAHMMLLLDDRSPRAVVVDAVIPPSAARVSHALLDAWPRLRGRVELRSADLTSATPAPGDVVACVHGCGGLTDTVLDVAIQASASVAVLPCCHAHHEGDTGGLGGWMDLSLAIDATRVARLRAAGYEVHTGTIPADVTPQNRLLSAWPRSLCLSDGS